MPIPFHRGTGEDLENALRQALDGNADDITSATTVEAARGTGEELEAQLRSRIAELEDDKVLGCDQVMAALSFRDEMKLLDTAVADATEALSDEPCLWCTYSLSLDQAVIDVFDDPMKETYLFRYNVGVHDHDGRTAEEWTAEIVDNIERIAEEKRAELGTPVESATDVEAAADISDPDFVERYLHTLIEDVTGILNDNGVFGTIADQDDENLYFTVSTEDHPATEYQVPLADLKMNFDAINTDIDYIIEGILPSSKGHEPVESATSTVADRMDAKYIGFLRIAERDADELYKRYNQNEESPYDILLSLGYQETAEDYYEKADGIYNIVFDFNQGNQYSDATYFVRYWVEKNGLIPKGFTTTKMNIDEDGEVQASESLDDELVDTTENPGEYTFVASKSVPEPNGFMTDYTWYKDADGASYFVYGDNDIYRPEDGYFDHVEEDPEAAQEWFDSYAGADDEDDDWDTLDADDIYTAEECKGHVSVEAAFEADWYFGKEQADQYGDLIAEKLSGKTVSKRRDKAEEPGGLIYEATQLGIDMWDLLGALEGLCYQGRAQEINDSTYKVL